MQTAFRWYGHSDRVPLGWLRQMTPRPLVVTHLSHVPPGEPWPLADLRALRVELAAHELELGPVESVFWTDDMKLGRPDRNVHIENYLHTLARLREAFPEPDELIVTYNLMPLDWGRTALAHLHPNGTRGMAYDHQAMARTDLSHGLFLPGWSRRYSATEFAALKQAYADLGTDGFWSNVRYVLAALVPAAAAHGIRLAAHPNDPPWSYLGLPAFLSKAADIRRLLALYPHRANALCFCTGSYGADPANDIPGMIREFKDSLAWMHLRTVKTTGEKCFHEADHADLTANVDLLAVMRTLLAVGWDGVFRSDHGLDLLYESDIVTNGYPAIDRYAANKMLWAYQHALKNGA
ncbi:MAG: mannonate dehydratase [Opitutales bacterium]